MAKRRGKRQGPPLHEIAADVLRDRGAPMHYRDLTDAIVATGRKTRGKTLSQTVSAMLTRRPEFERVAPSVYKLTEPDQGGT